MAALDVVFLAIDIVGIVAAPFTGGASLAATTAAKAGLRATIKGAVKVAAKKVSKEAIKAGAKQTGELLSKLTVKNLTGGKLCVFACFPAGTPVAVKDGYRNIEDIQIGDEVWAWDESSGEVGLKKVTSTLQRDVHALVELAIEGETIYTTPEHPFFVDGEWKEAGLLEINDQVQLFTSKMARVESVQFSGAYSDAEILHVNSNHEVLDIGSTEHIDNTRVYNLEVDGFATYFVGRFKALVHNSTQKCLTALMRELVEFTSKKYNIGNVVILLDKKGMKHILSRHHPKYWDGSVKEIQTFLSKHLKPADIKRGIGEVIKQNKDAIMKNGTSRGQYKGIVDGIERTIGFKNGRIGQYY